MVAKTETKPDLKVIDSGDGTELEKPYEPTPQEQVVLDTSQARTKHAAPIPTIHLSAADAPMDPHAPRTVCQRIVHGDPSGKTTNAMLMEAFQTKYPEAAQLLVNNLIGVAVNSNETDVTRTDHFNQMLTMAIGIEPRDQIEAMLAVQMTVVHNAVLSTANRLAVARSLEARDSAERAYNKLARTFTAEVDALAKHRTRGKQKIEVKHVTVKDGGQAIVGDVNTGGTGK